MSSNFSPSTSPRSREVDPRIPEAINLFQEVFQAGSPGAEWLASMTPSKTTKISVTPSHGIQPKVDTSHGVVVPPPHQRKLFAEPSGSGAEDDNQDECQRLKEDLSEMTAELERSRHLLDVKFAEIQEREENLESIIQDSVNQALLVYMKNNQPDVPKPAPSPMPELTPASGYGDSVHDSHAAIKLICGSSNILARLMSKVDLPDRFKNEKYEVQSVVDFFFRAHKKYTKLNEVFTDALDGASLILAVQKFRDLFLSYSGHVSSDLLDWLTIFAVSSQSDGLYDKVSSALEVACSVNLIGRQSLFNQMMSSGVLPAVGGMTDILDSAGAVELFSPGTSQLALKSICNFVVSYCGYFDDITSKAQDSKREFIKQKYVDTADCQARFSEEQKAYNLVMVWYGGDFMLPLERAQLFLAKSPLHVKKQYANDSDLHVGITWQKFKHQMASAWVDAFKKRRMMVDMGIEIDLVPDVLDVPYVPYPPSASMFTHPAPAPSFNSGVDDVLIDLQCKEEGCGVFKYSQQKIQWLRDKFGSDFKMPSRCVKHKAIADAERNGSLSENPAPVPVSVPVPPAIPTPPANRFGSRRTPNAAPGI